MKLFVVSNSKGKGKVLTDDSNVITSVERIGKNYVGKHMNNIPRKWHIKLVNSSIVPVEG